MSNEVHAKHGKLNLRTGVKVSLGAIGLTIMGDTFFELLTNLPGTREEWQPTNWDWSGRNIWHAVLVIIVFLGACWKFEDFVEWLFRRTKDDGRGETNATDLESIDTPDALVVYVSVPAKDKQGKLILDDKTQKPREPAYQALIRRLILEKQSGLPKKHRHVYLVHSTKSKEYGLEYKSSKQIRDNAYLTVHLDDPLWADFTNTASCHRACKNAVERARSQSGVETVVIDITGGTKPSSSAAVLAGLDLDVDLCYIEQTEGNPIKGVDVEWRRAAAS